MELLGEIGRHDIGVGRALVALVALGIAPGVGGGPGRVAAQQGAHPHPVHLTGPSGQSLDGFERRPGVAIL